MGGKSSKSSISEEDLHFLMRNTNKSSEEIQVKPLFKIRSQEYFYYILPSQEWHRGFLNDCPSGELSKSQFVTMYSKMFQGTVLH